MREFIYYSPKARTSGNFKDPMKAGRLDIVFNVIIQALYLSNKIREDVRLHLIFNGMPNPPMHLEFDSSLAGSSISKKDIGGLIKRMLYKCNDKKRTEVFPGCFIEKKSFRKLLDEFEEGGKKILILDGKGDELRRKKDKELGKAVFVIGDHEGLPKKEVKKYDKVSIGKKTYFASQVFVILNHEIDLREI